MINSVFNKTQVYFGPKLRRRSLREVPLLFFPQALYAALIGRSVARPETNLVWDRVLRGSGTVGQGWDTNAT